MISRPCNLTPATWTVLISIALVNSLLKRARYDCEQFQSEVDKPSSQDMKVEKLSLLVVKKKGLQTMRWKTALGGDLLYSARPRYALGSTSEDFKTTPNANVWNE